MQFLIKILFLCCIIASCVKAQYNYANYVYVWGHKEVQMHYTFVIENIDMEDIELESDEIRSDYKVRAFYIHHTTSTTIPEDYVKIFKNLTSLRVGDTDLTHVTADIMQNLENITNLYLGKNQIDVIDHNAFDSLLNLTNLYLNGNKISQLDESTFFGLQKIQMIMLDDNQLTSLSSKLFSKNHNLSSIHAANNKIATIEPSFFEHPSVKNYDLSHNRCINMKTGWYNIQDLKLHAESCCQVQNYLKCLSSIEDDSHLYNNHV